MPRGRPRDENAKRRILEAAFDLVGSRGRGTVTVDAIADAAGVAKQTIYRWWPSRTAVILDALVVGTMRETPFRETADPRDDFRRHLRAVVRLFTSPSGRLISELVAAAQSDPEIAAEFRTRFWGPRRDLSLARLNRAMEMGVVRSDLDAEAALDAIYGPLWLELLVGHRPLRLSDADAILDAVWPSLVGGSTAS